MSRFLPWAVAILMVFMLFVALWNNAWLYQLWNIVTVAGLVLLVLVAIPEIIKVIRFGQPPVEWPDAKVGVATVEKVLSVTEIKDGRRLVNMSVQVEPADGNEAFSSAFIRRVPQKSVAGIQPGLQFPAMYRPDRPEKIKIARGVKQGEGQRFFDRVRVRDGMVQVAEVQAAREGVLTEAEVLSIAPTGRVLGGASVYDVDLRVHRAGATPFAHRKSMPLSSFEYSLLAATPRVRVKYLAENPQAVAVAIENRQEELS